MYNSTPNNTKARDQHPGLFWCRSCKEWKPNSQFRTDYRSPLLKPRGQCLECRRKLGKRYNKTLRKLGLPQVKYDHMGICPICEELKKLVIDHNHLTNKLRDRICHRCNMALGFIEKCGPDLLNKLHKYLEKHNGKG